jgi:hypothetical protein
MIIKYNTIILCHIRNDATVHYMSDEYRISLLSCFQYHVAVNKLRTLCIDLKSLDQYQYLTRSVNHFGNNQ